PIERRHDRGSEFQRRLPDAARDRLCLLLGDHFGEPLSSTSQERGCGPDCISLDGESPSQLPPNALRASGYGNLGLPWGLQLGATPDVPGVLKGPYFTGLSRSRFTMEEREGFPLRLRNSRKVILDSYDPQTPDLRLGNRIRGCGINGLVVPCCRCVARVSGREGSEHQIRSCWAADTLLQSSDLAVAAGSWARRRLFSGPSLRMPAR